MELFVLVEDTAEDTKFEAEHGLSVYFEKDSKRFLFDLGQSDAFLKNSKKLGLDLSKTDFLCFSHGHCDHTGGIDHFRPAKATRIIAHPHALLPKYHKDEYIGFPDYRSDIVIELKDEVTKLSENVYFLGQIPGKRRYSLGQFTDKGRKNDDFLLDDSALAVIEKDRMVIIAGCAHADILNIVRYAKKTFRKDEMIIVGGFHMLHYTDDEIKETIQQLKHLGVSRVFPGHCTGEKAVARLLDEFEGERLCSGKMIEL